MIRRLAVSIGLLGHLVAIVLWLTARDMETAVTDSNQNLVDGWAGLIAGVSVALIVLVVSGPSMVRTVKEELRPTKKHG
jgi:hypothetical protein